MNEQLIEQEKLSSIIIELQQKEESSSIIIDQTKRLVQDEKATIEEK
jgi:hypothetical protein